MKVNELIEGVVNNGDRCERATRHCCPVCGGTNIRVDDDGGPYDDGFNPAIEDGEIEYDMICDDCDSSFAQHYALGSFIRVDSIHKGKYA